jgi:glycosyltransferase involved in cell wall biosynthesis
MKINLLGQRSILGGGTHFSNFSNALKQFAFFNQFVREVDLLNSEQVAVLGEHSNHEDINIYFFGFGQLKQLRGRNIVWAIFESDRLPSSFVENLSLADVIWAPSHWAKKVLVTHGIEEAKIDVVPEGVNGAHYHPYLRKRQAKAPSEIFTFLAVGKFEERKSYAQLLNAFSQVFGNNSSVQLLIKADYFLDLEKKHQTLQKMVDSFSLKNIKIVQGSVTENDLLVLYSYADAFVFPSRAEGWGLPLIEALATGLPAIATNYSGHSEFLEGMSGLYMPLQYDIIPIEDEEYLKFWDFDHGASGNWAQVNVDDLGQKMLEMKNMHGQWIQKGLKASAWVRNHFDWCHAADTAIEVLMQRGYLSVNLHVNY